MCWDRHCSAALWSATGRQRLPSFGKHGCLPFKNALSNHRDSEGLCPPFPPSQNSSSLVLFWCLLPFCPAVSFSFQMAGSNQRPAPPRQSAQCSWLTFNSKDRVKKGTKEHEMGRATGVHSHHFLSSTSASIRCQSPRGSAGALSQRSELTDAGVKAQSTGAV